MDCDPKRYQAPIVIAAKQTPSTKFGQNDRPVRLEIAEGTKYGKDADRGHVMFFVPRHDERENTDQRKRQKQCAESRCATGNLDDALLRRYPGRQRLAGLLKRPIQMSFLQVRAVNLSCVPEFMRQRNQD